MVFVVTVSDVHVTVRAARQRPCIHVDAVSVVVLWLISVPESGIKRNQPIRAFMKDKISVKIGRSFTFILKLIYLILGKCSYLTICRCHFHPHRWLQSRVDTHSLASCK